MSTRDQIAAPSISVDSVGKVFRRRGRSVEALRGVSCDIAAGEFVSLLGPSGCGKSTLLRIIGGLQTADAGEVAIGRLDADAARAAKQFGLVPQAPALCRGRRSATTSASSPGCTARRRPRPRCPTPRSTRLLETVGLAGFDEAYPHELSGGMQQRASLVRAFALGAPILLMDEPFAALDEITRADMRYLLLDLWQRTGTTVVFVTHSVTEAVILSDRVVVMAAAAGPDRRASGSIDLPRPRTPDDGGRRRVPRRTSASCAPTSAKATPR